MRHIGGHEETIAWSETLRLSTDFSVERASHDVRHLTVRVMVNGADSPFSELHSHEHEVGTMSEYLAPNAFADRLPWSVAVAHE